MERLVLTLSKESIYVHVCPWHTVQVQFETWMQFFSLEGDSVESSLFKHKLNRRSVNSTYDQPAIMAK